MTQRSDTIAKAVKENKSIMDSFNKLKNKKEAKLKATTSGFDPIGGVVNLVNAFLGGGLAGLLALMVFASFMD